MYYCENGHYLGKDYQYEYCPQCGAKAISKCPSCGSEIQETPNKLTRYCVLCGKPFQWQRKYAGPQTHSDAMLEEIQKINI